jgi:DNA-binding PadR family transcriptional regulator
MELKTIAKLDAVLNCLYNHRTEKHIKFKDLAEFLLKDNTPVDFGEIMQILTKLEKDSYIEFDDRAVGEQDELTKFNRVYRVTFEGRYLIESGGYVEERQSLDSRKRWEDRLLVQGEKNGERLNTLTLILCIGTICLALVELVEFLYKLSCQSHP